MDVLTTTSHHALKALIYLARHVDTGPVTGARIAEATGIPPKYLSKILGDLTRSGVLTSIKGKRGGFTFVQPPEKTFLLSVLAPFERLEQRRCPFANQACSSSDPCAAHAEWSRVLEYLRGFFARTTIAEISTKQAEMDRRRRPRSRKSGVRRTTSDNLPRR